MLIKKDIAVDTSKIGSAISGTMNIATAPSTGTFTNTTVYFGSQSGLQPQASSFYTKCPVPVDMTLKAVSLFVNKSGAAVPTTEAVKIYLQRNNVNVATITETLNILLNNPTMIVKVDVPMKAGDFWNFKVIYPNWATPPTSVYYQGLVYYSNPALQDSFIKLNSNIKKQ